MKPSVKSIFFTFIFLLLSTRLFPQVVLNEICPSNSSVFANDDGDFDDWIELYNAGGSAVNLQGYGVSDDPSDPYRFTFPSYFLPANGRVVIFCSDKNQTELVNHWETPVTANSTWKYFVGTSNPDTNWRNNSFNDNPWSTGTGGFGFGDGDDNTTITTCNAVMLRKHFTVTDTSRILKAIFNIDYDDGFVAYLNGVEIARANLGVEGDRPAFNVPASSAHEALMYQGMKPDSFFINQQLLKSSLRVGDNVLAVQVHNLIPSNPDLSAIPFLTFGVKDSIQTWPAPPVWFGNAAGERFQADFKLARAGETVYLTNPSAVVVDQKMYTQIELDNSIGRKPDGSVNWCFFNAPTPNASNNNSTCYAGYATIPLYSLQGGFYTGAQWLTLTTTQPGGVIRFTTDGKDVTDTSTTYTSTILINSTRTIKARVFATGYLPSQTIINTYFINESVHYPVFSITTDPANLFDYNTGIYVYGPNADTINYPYFGSNFWQDWEKPAGIEFYDKDKNRVSRFNADIKIYGNYSRAKQQKSFEIKLKDKYGMDELHYSLYSQKPYIDAVNNIVLRNAGSDNNTLHFRDHLMQQNLSTTHCDYIAQDEAILYINGQFWGIYQVAENDDHHYMKNNYGVGENNVDLLREGSTLQTKEGSATEFINLFNYAVSNPPNDPSYLPTISSMLDVSNFADYFISETYYCNTDWLGDWTNNVKLWRPQDPGGKWRYLNYDMDFGLYLESSPFDNMLGTAINPASACMTSDLFDTLLNNVQFRTYFINRYADLINTIFLPSHMLPQLQAIRDSMALDISLQYSRWGLTPQLWSTEYSKATQFINLRPVLARNFVQSEFNLAGQDTLTLNVSPPGAGRIKISTITPGPLPWSGVYFHGNPVTITAIPNPGYTFDHWQSNVDILTPDFNQTTTYDFTANDQITAYFTGTPSPALITFSEINYHSDSLVNPDDWIELHNYGSADIDLSGWKFRDDQDNHTFEFPLNTVLPAGGYLVLAEDMGKFAAAFPSVTNVLGPLGFSFANGDDQLRLFDYRDSLYLSVYYSDQLPWPEGADGGGYTCELLDPLGDLNNGNNWFAGCLYGSPGSAYSNILADIDSSGSLAFCAPGSVTLSVSSGNGFVYQWMLDGVEINGQNGSSLTANSSGWYSVQLDSAGCRAIDSVLVTAVFVSNPVAVPDFHCGPGSVSITALSPSLVSWYDAPNGNLLANGDTYNTPIINNSTTYYAAADSVNCRSNYIPVTASILTVTATPVTSNVSRCGTGSVTLVANDTAVIRWYDQPSGGTLLYTGSSFTTPVLSNTTTYYVEAGVVCPSPRVAASAIIVTVSSPNVTNGSRCGAGTVTLSATSPNPVDWYDQPSGGNFLGTTYNYTTPPLSATTTFYAEAVNNGCSSTRVPVIATVVVNPPPSTVSDSRCGPGVVTLTATASDSIYWFDAAVGGNLVGTGSPFNTPVLISSATYYAQTTLACPSARTPADAIINPVAADPVTTDDNICGNNSGTVTATAIEAITWYDDQGTIVGIGNSYTSPVLTSTTVYYAVAGNLCPSQQVPATIFIQPASADPVTNGDSVCVSGSMTLTAVSVDPITWYDDQGTIVGTGTSFTTPVLSQTTTYYAVAGIVCPSNQIAAVAVVHPVSVDPVTTDDNICANNTGTVTATAIEAITWYDDQGTIVGTGNSFTTPVLTSTTVYYAVAGTLCPSNQVAATITVTPASAPPQVNSSFHCGTGDVTLTANSPDPISWYDAPSGGNLLGTGSTLTLTGISATTVVYAQAGTLCPSQRVSDTAYIFTPPFVDLGPDIIISSPQSAILDAGAGFASYLWSTGETTQTIIVNTTNTYSVTVTDANGCTGSDNILVTVFVGIVETVSGSINIYPNPVHDVLTIGLPSSMAKEEKLLKFSDVTGRLVFSEWISGSGLHELNVSSLAKGVYILTLESASQKRVVQVIVN